MMWATLGANAPVLAVIVVTGGLLIRYFIRHFPSIAAIAFTGERRRAAFEVLRLQHQNAASIPTYLAPDDPQVPEPRQCEALSKEPNSSRRRELMTSWAHKSRDPSLQRLSVRHRGLEQLLHLIRRSWMPWARSSAAPAPRERSGDEGGPL